MGLKAAQCWRQPVPLASMGVLPWSLCFGCSEHSATWWPQTGSQRSWGVLGSAAEQSQTWKSEPQKPCVSVA